MKKKDSEIASKFLYFHYREFLKLTSWRLNVYYELTLVHKTPVLCYTTHRRREMKLISQRKQHSVSFIPMGCYTLSSSLSLLWIEKLLCPGWSESSIAISVSPTFIYVCIRRGKSGCWIDNSEWKKVFFFLPCSSEREYPFVFSFSHLNTRRIK